MRLTRVRVTNYRSIEDSGWVDIDDVTCLVGKNEAGKTAFLQALHKLNPLLGSAMFDETMDYPSRHYARYKRTRDASPAPVVIAELELGDDEMRAIAAEFGEGFLGSKRVTATKRYGSEARTWDHEINEAKGIEHLVSSIEATAPIKKRLLATTTADELASAIDALDEPHSTAVAVADKIRGWRGEDFGAALRDGYLRPWLPKFFYFDDYSIMPGRASIPDLITRRDQETLQESDETLLRLLDLVGAKLEDFSDQGNFEALTRELEAAANGISSEVFQYWKQNPDLEIVAVMSAAEEGAQPPLDVGPVLNIRIRNPRHKVTVPFDERSKGFVWFFSFFAYFSELESGSGENVILLLDEPGLSLHATAQRDFLDFIDGRLAQSHQVIYTTHSPFMIQAGRLDRVRTVEDVDDDGTKVNADVLRTDADTVFPLQAALGYDLAQTLFVGPDCLLVEGPSDLLYLQILTEALVGDGREGLDERWVVTPAGGASNLITFVSLLGANQLNLAVLMDSSQAEQQRVRNLLSTGKLKARSIVQISDVVGNDDADIEDIFEAGFYLELVNGAYSAELSAPIKVADIREGNPRVVVRVGEYFQSNDVGTGRFNHYRPAAYLLANQAKLAPKINAATLDRAGALAEKLNKLLG